MSAEIILITGGARSGKSGFAQRLAEQYPGGRIFLATCRAEDAEMEDRIVRHQREREGRGWKTEEEPLDLVRVLDRAPADELILLDCLTLWISNLLMEADGRGEPLGEDAVARRAEELARAASRRRAPLIAVTNEVGLGIVPDNPLARRFRDLVGRCNQVLAAAADKVYLVTCGLETRLK